MFNVQVLTVWVIVYGGLSLASSTITKRYTAVFLDPGDDTVECSIITYNDNAPIISSLRVTYDQNGATSQLTDPHTFACPRNGSSLEMGRAIFLTVTLGLNTESIAFFGLINGSAGSDAFMIYEHSAFLGTSVPTEYMAMTFCDVVGFCQLAIAAIEEATVEVVLPKNQNFTNPSCVVDYNGTRYDENNPTLTESIPQGAVLQIQAACDLTGTLVRTSSHVAVFSGSHSIIVGWGNSKDMMIEQLVPTRYWGQEYIMYPYPQSLNGDIVSIMASESDTEVRIMGYGQYILKEARQFIRRRIESDRPVRIWASKKVSVAQYILDYINEESAMVIVPPVTQYVEQTVVNSEMNNYLTSKSKTISWKKDTNSPSSQDLASSMEVKTSDYYVGVVNIAESDDFTIEPVTSGQNLGGYRVLSADSGSSLFATSLGFKLQTTTSTKPHVPGDEVDNDGDGHVDEDSCTVDSWQSETDCNTLEPVGNRDSGGHEFIIPLLHLSGDTTKLFTKMNVLGTPTHAGSVTWVNTIATFLQSSCFKTPDFSSSSSSTRPVIIGSSQSAFEAHVYLVLTGLAGATDHGGNMFAGLPVEVLGLEYFALTHCSDNSNCQHACSIAAAYDGTEVLVAGRNNQLTLNNKHQTFTFTDSNDLSGTYIRSNNPIALTCGGMIENGGVSQFQIPPTNSWGKIYRVIFSNSDTGVLRFLTSDGNTVVTLFEYEYSPVQDIDSSGQTLTKTYTYRTVYAINDPGETRSFTIENNTAYFLEASKPILVVYLPSSPDFPIILVASTEAIMKNVTTVTSVSGTCGSQTMSFAVLDGEEYFVPYYKLDDFMTSWWMNIPFTTSPHTVTDQVPGDRVDNDGDGLVDEDFCGYLVTELDGKSFLFDIDIDGALNEDCKGCAMGQELNEYLGCSSCEIGTYREVVGVDKCVSCDVNYTTFYTASDSSSKCVDVCFEGTEYDTTSQTCQECGIGFYKSVNSSDWRNNNYQDRWYCKACPDNKTTLYTGTKDQNDCTAHCGEGYQLVPYGPGSSCSPCDIGWYKNTSSESLGLSETERWNCTQCPDNKTTIETGADNIALCLEPCMEGFELNNNTNNCTPCEIGFYKEVVSTDMTVDVVTRWRCKQCPASKTTLDIGTTSSAECRDHCDEGYELNVYRHDGQCRKCDYGKYKIYSSSQTDKSASERWNCSLCASNETTLQQGSNSSSDCVVRCSLGQEFNVSTQLCDVCPIGFYKNVTGNLDYCEECPNNETTDGTGTIDGGLCRPVKRVCMCPCNMVNVPKNYSEEEKQQVLEGHVKDLKTDVKKLSSTLRKKISAPDDRPSSTAFGGLGIIMITFALALLVFFDFPTLKDHAQMFFHNVKAIFNRG